MMKVRINKEECIGCAACTAVAPDYFELLDGKATIIKDDIPDDVVEELISVCPVEAIKKVD